MTSLKRTMFSTTAAQTAAQTRAQMGALTDAWKKAFDGPIREAAMKRAVPGRRSRKTATTGIGRSRMDPETGV